MEQQNELDILKSFQHGDLSSLDFIFEKYKSLVTSIARQFFLVGAEPEDLIQEGMIGLYKACQNFNEKLHTSFKSFAHLCITRQIQTAIKAANRQKNLVLSRALSISSKDGIMFIDAQNAGVGEKILYLPNIQLSPEHVMLEQENYNELLDSIKKSLSKFEYQILELYLDGYRAGQIASMTNNTYKAVDNALYRIKNKLHFLNK